MHNRRWIVILQSFAVALTDRSSTQANPLYFVRLRNNDAPVSCRQDTNLCPSRKHP